VRSPAASANCQPFLRSTGDSNPRKYARAPARLDPPKPRADPLHHFLKPLRPALRILSRHPRHLLIPRSTLNGTSFLGLLQHIDIEGKMTQLNIF
jgi:hypothetical protein